MTYLEQILKNAQQQGGLTDEQFASMFGGYIPQQQVAPNMGMPMPEIRQPTMIKQTQVPMKWGSGVNTTQLSKSPDANQEMISLMDRMQIEKDYNIDPTSEQAKMLAEQDKDINDWETQAKDGLMSFFGF